MLALKIIGGFVCLIILHLIYDSLNSKCLEKYGYPLFFKEAFIGAIMTGFISGLGYFWYRYALENHKDTLNGKVVIVFGAILFLFVIIAIFKRPVGNKMTIGILNLIVSCALYTALFFLTTVLIAGAIVMLFLGILGIFVGPRYVRRW